VDLPGYGYARVPKNVTSAWKGLIEHYLLHREALAICFLLLDARRGWMEKDLELKNWLEFHNRRYLVIATKTDKLKTQKEQKHGMDAIRNKTGSEPLPFSAIQCRGAREIWQAIWKTTNNNRP
jgi:GTP-binding protein